MSFYRKVLKSIDLILICTLLLIMAVGLVILYSATQTDVDPFNRLRRQIEAFSVGLVCILLIMTVDYRALERFTPILYLVNILMLGSVLFFGIEEYGAQRWISLGPINIQPSEFAKIMVICTLAYSMSLRNGKHTFIDVLVYLVHVGIPMGLILIQPDLGTAVVLIGVLFGMMLLGGVPLKYICFLIGVGIASSPLVYKYLLKDYQINRLLSFINPELDRFGTGYNIIQSKVAIGSGGIFGKGFLQGTQNQLNFLPVKYNDFIFAVLSEEFGFIGGVALIVLYSILLWRCLRIILYAKDEFGRLLAAGILSFFFFHIVTNIGMSLAILPVTGIPLPFVSYGGTYMLANMLALGILLNVYMRRYKLTFQ